MGQLAQFGTVQGLAGLQTSFDSLASSLVSNQALASFGARRPHRVGQTRRASASPRDSRSRGAVELPAASGAVNVTIRDATGQPVRTLEPRRAARGPRVVRLERLRPMPASRLPAGRYSFSAAYRNGADSVAADTFLRAPIDSVLLGADGFSVELRGIGEVPFIVRARDSQRIHRHPASRHQLN